MPLPTAPNYALVTEADELLELTDLLIAESAPVAYDIETSYEGAPRPDAQKHPEENFICGFSLTNSLAWARAIPIGFESGPNIDPRLAAECLWRISCAVDAEGRPLLVSHNAIFEARCSARLFTRHLGDHPEFGQQVRASGGYYPLRSDTMVEAYIEAAHQSYGLKALTKETFDHQMTEIAELFGDKLTQGQQERMQFHLLDVTDPKVRDYMCEDALWALAHHRRRFPLVTDPAFHGYKMYAWDMRLLPVLCKMEDVGVRYDWNLMREWAARGKVFMDKLAGEILADLTVEMGRPVAVNLSSPAQLSKLLYDDLKLPVKRRSDKTGKPSTDKLAIAKLAKTHPVAKKIQDWRGLKRLCVDNYLGKYEADYSYAPDGMAHPNFLPCAVITGRFASTRPAVQQSPKKYRYQLSSGESFEVNFRDCITVPPPGALGDSDLHGWYLLGFDFSQAELRAFAGEAGETALIEAFARGDDVHRTTAALMLGKPLSAVTDQDRSVGKTLNFAVAYGLGVDGLADRLQVSKDEAQQLFDAWSAAYPRIRAWTERTVTEAKRTGYTLSRFGRKHPIWEFRSTNPAIYAKGGRLAGNAPIQGAATGDVPRMAMVRADAALAAAGLADKVHLFLNVHDALEWYVRRDVPPEKVISVLEPAVIFDVPGWPPMVADWHLGLRWGSVKAVTVSTDGRVTVTGAAPQIVSWDGDDDPELPPPVETEGGREMPKSSSPTAETVQVQQGSLESVNAPEDLSTPVDRPGRVVAVTVQRAVTSDAMSKFLTGIRDLAGPNRVVFRTADGEEVLVPHLTGLTPRHRRVVGDLLGVPVTVGYAR